MVVGACRLVLHIPHASSLKDKRAVVKSAVEQVQHRFRIAAAEVGAQDCAQIAELGLAAVGTHEAMVRRVLDAAATFIEERFPVEMAASEIYFT